MDIRGEMATQAKVEDNAMPTPELEEYAFESPTSDVPSAGTPNLQFDATSSSGKKRRRSASDDVASTLADLTTGMRECIKEASTSISNSISTSFNMLNQDANMVESKERLLGELLEVPGVD